jgi:hypothetical protein
MWEDPIVADVRRAREELSARFNFDVKAIFADMRNRQGALGDRLVSRRKRSESKNTTAQEKKPSPPVPLA